MEWSILFTVFLVVVFTSLIQSGKRTRKLKLPPGPWQIPILGSIYAFKKPLHKHFSKLSEKYGPILYLRVGVIPVVVVSNANLVKEMLKSHDLEFASRPDTAILRQITLEHNTIGLSPFTPKLIKLRKIASTNLFTPSKLVSGAAQRLHRVHLLVKQVLDSSQTNAHVNLTSLFYEVISGSIFHMLFGRLLSSEILESESLFLEKHLKVINDEALSLSVGDMFPRLASFDFKFRGLEQRLREQLIPQLKCFFNRIIEDHKARPAREGGLHDFLDVLLSLKEEDSLEDIQIMGILSSVVVAGISTSEVTMDYAMAELLRHPKVLRKVQNEIDTVVGKSRLLEEADVPKLAYLNAVIKETLRLHNPAPLGLPHCNPMPAQLGGYDIPANTTLFINLWAMGQNESVWENAQEFHPDRFMDNRVIGEECDFVPFGAGKRKCLGQGYAMRLIPLVIGTLAQAFDWEVAEVDMSETIGGGIKRTKDLVAQAYPRLQDI